MFDVRKCGSVIGMVCDNEVPGKKKLQKLMYLMERKGLDLNLNYGIHFYGPYSSKLDDTLHFLETEDIISIDTSGPTHKICKGSETYTNVLNNEEIEIVESILNIFEEKTPLELEAMTTIDFVANVTFNGRAQKDEILNKVIDIKGEKFKLEDLQNDFEILRQYNFVA